MSPVPPSPPWWRKHWFLLGLAAVMALASAWPRLGAPGGTFHSDRWNWLIVTTLFFLSGLALRTADIPAALADWRLHLFTQGFNLALMPALFWAAAVGLAAAGLDRGLCLGLIVLGALSTTTATGVILTRSAGGDAIGALFNAALGSFLGVILSPVLILVMTGRSGSVPLAPVIEQLMIQVLAPLLAGQALQHLLPRPTARLRPGLGSASQGLLLVLVWVILCTGFARGLDASAGNLALIAAAVVILHVTALAAAFALSGWGWLSLTRPRRTAAVICATQKSAALGVPLLLILFGKDASLGRILLPLLIYHPLQLVFASLLLPRFLAWNGNGSPPTASA